MTPTIPPRPWRSFEPIRALILNHGNRQLIDDLNAIEAEADHWRNAEPEIVAALEAAERAMVGGDDRLDLEYAVGLVRAALSRLRP